MSENKDVKLSSISKASSYEAIGAFWDEHDTTDYFEQFEEVEVEMHLPRSRRVAIDADMYDALAQEATRKGVSVETLVNVWLAAMFRNRDNQANRSTQAIAEESGKYDSD